MLISSPVILTRSVSALSHRTMSSPPAPDIAYSLYYNCLNRFFMTNTTFQFSTTRVFAQFGGVTNSLRLRQEETLKGLLQEEERPHCSGENVPTRISASISRVRQKGDYEAGQKQVCGRGTVGSWRGECLPERLAYSGEDCKLAQAEGTKVPPGRMMASYPKWVKLMFCSYRSVGTIEFS